MIIAALANYQNTQRLQVLTLIRLYNASSERMIFGEPLGRHGRRKNCESLPQNEPCWSNRPRRQKTHHKGVPAKAPSLLSRATQHQTRRSLFSTSTAGRLRILPMI